MIIDEKGKLFGKINIIDLLVILVLIALSPMIYFGYRIINQPLPVISKVEPENGLNINDITINVYGSNFHRDAQVKIGPNVLKRINAGKNEIVVVVPKGAQSGTFDVVVLNPGNIASAQNARFTINAPPPSPLFIAETEIYLKFSNIDKNVAESIEVGDITDGQNDKAFAEIVDIVRFRGVNHKIDLGEGREIWRENPDKIDVICKLRLAGEVNEGRIFFNDKDVSIKSKLRFVNSKYELEGTIVPAPGLLTFEEAILYCEFKNVPNDIFKIVSVGDKTEDNKRGNSGEILDIISYKLSDLDINIASNEEKIVRVELSKKDALCKLKIRGEIRKGDFYFNDEKISLTAQIVFSNSRYKLEGKIVPVPKIRTYTEIEALCDFKNVPNNIVKLIKKGDKTHYYKGNGEILDIVNSIRSSEVSNAFKIIKGNKDGKLVYQDVLCKVGLMCETVGNELYFNNTKVALNKKIEFSNKKYSLKGYIVQGNEFETSVEAIIYCDFKNVPNNIAELITKGDKLSQEGRMVSAGEIIEILYNKDSKISINKENNNVEQANRQNNKDVSCKLKIRCYLDKYKLVFNGKELKVNSVLDFISSEYKLNSFVKKIQVLRKFIYVTVRFNTIIPEVVNLIKQGDEEFKENLFDGIALKKINKVSPDYSVGLMRIDNRYCVVENADYKMLEIQFTVPETIFIGKKIKVGRPFSFTTAKYEINGTVINIKN